MADKIKIVLVHGAFADGSHWQHIVPGLHRAGYRVVAARNPLTSLVDDVARTRKLAEWMDGPTLLVGAGVEDQAKLVPGLDPGPDDSTGDPAVGG